MNNELTISLTPTTEKGNRTRIVKVEYGKTAILRTARKEHTCCESQLPIRTGTQYYSIYFGNPARAMSPDRVLPEYLDRYWQHQHRFLDLGGQPC
jgi:hypothetical protein